MKYLFTLFLCAAAFGADEGDRSRHAAGLFGRWIVPGYQTGNGAVPTKVLDATGTTNNIGNTVGSPAFGQLSGRQTLSTTTNAYVSLSGVGAFSAPLTVSFWFRRRATYIGPTVLSDYDSVATKTSLTIEYRNSSLRYIFAYGTYTIHTTAAVFTELNTWTHAAFTESVAGVVRAWKNGAELSVTKTGGSIRVKGGTFTIGRGGSYTGNEAYWVGDLADVRIYNRALTGAEVAALYKEGLR